MQPRAQMIPMMNSFPPTNITTEQIQEYLDENKKLILAILDNQNLGKLAECAQYQAQLQKNLMYLAAIADAQPQTPAMLPQMAPHPAMQPGYCMQHHQAAAMAQQQQGVFPSKPPPQFGNQHQMPDHYHQQPQPQPQTIQGQMGMRPMHGAALGGGPPSNDPRGRNKQKDASVPSSAAAVDVESS